MSGTCTTCQGRGFDLDWAFAVGVKEGTPLSTEEAKRRCPCIVCEPKAAKPVMATVCKRIQHDLVCKGNPDYFMLRSMVRFYSPILRERIQRDASWSEFQYNGWLRL